MKAKVVRGIKVPEVGLGTHRLYSRECTQTVREALDLGYRHIDTAQMYKNEKEIGQAIRKSPVDREDVFLTTKVWHTNLAHDELLQSVEESLQALDTPYVDLLLIHWPPAQVPLERSFEAMMTLRDQGKVSNIGVSNFTVPLLKKSIEEFGVPVFCNQIEFHPFLHPFDILDYSYEHEFLVTAYSPLAQGQVAEHEVLRSIAAEYDKSPAQIAIRWLIEQENVVAIPKATGNEHLRENIDIYDFQLSDEHFEQIDELEGNLRLVNPSFAPVWD
jgi:2,5-diketo-D-gluconate reductase B